MDDGFCSKCGATLDEGASFCSKCGKPTQEFCSKCGAALDQEANFCPKCGQPIQSMPTQIASPPPQQYGINSAPERGSYEIVGMEKGRAPEPGSYKLPTNVFMETSTPAPERGFYRTYTGGMGRSAASLILGIVSLILACLALPVFETNTSSDFEKALENSCGACAVSCMSMIGIPLAIVTLLLGISGRARHANAGYSAGMANTGIVLGVISLFLYCYSCVSIASIDKGSGVGHHALIGAARRTAEQQAGKGKGNSPLFLGLSGKLDMARIYGEIVGNQFLRDVKESLRMQYFEEGADPVSRSWGGAK